MTEDPCVIVPGLRECQRKRRNSGSGMDGVTRVIVDQVNWGFHHCNFLVSALEQMQDRSISFFTVDKASR